VTALIRAEVRRLTSRRMFRVIVLVMLGITLIVLGRQFVASHRDPAVTAQIEQAQQRDRTECERLKQGGDIPAEEPCDNIQFGPRPSDPRLQGRTALPEGTEAIAVTVAILGFMIGASYIGAEWHAGTLQALLFWEPRRGRVLLAKAVALVVVLVAFLFAMEAVTYALRYLTAATRGSTEGVTAGLHVSNLLLALRGAVFVSCTGLLGYAIAGLARWTVAAVGAAFVYFVVLENLIRGLRPGWARYLFSENTAAILKKSLTIQQVDTESSNGFDGLTPQRVFHLSGQRGVLTVAIYLGLLLGAFYLSFTRRDVT
jgi:ABC-type transport system involved in multi-copper enzyme maturation permease subunit